MKISEFYDKSIARSLFSIGGREMQFLLFDRINAVSTLWEQLPIERIFLSVPYLEVMEISGLQDTEPYYGLLVSESDTIQACFYYQIKLFKAEESLKIKENGGVKGLQLIRNKLKRKLASQITFNTLVQGNLSLSGPFGHWVHPELEHEPGLIFKVAESAFRMLQSTKPNLKAILLKDYYESLSVNVSSFAEFRIQPAMEMKLDRSWSGIEDYENALRSKYRVRYRKARDRIEGLERRHVGSGEISMDQLDQIYDLYANRAESSDFNIASLDQDYFRKLNEKLTGSCSYWLYILKGRVVAYMCMLNDHHSLHAHFTGYDESLNREHDLYLNLLFDVVESAIGLGAYRICFARTAMEIKSGVGADPRDLYCYMYYDSSISQLFIPSIVKYLEPKKEWNNRQPFKN